MKTQLMRALNEGIETELPELMSLHGVSGHEEEVRRYLDEKFSRTSLNRYTDALGNLIVGGSNDGTAKVMIAAHMDEIGLMIRHIDLKGFIYFEMIGGIRPQNLFARTCRIKTRNGYVQGLINSIRPGRPYQDDAVPNIHDFFIDIGATNAKDAEDRGVMVGQVVKLEYPFLKIGNKISGTALDDRALVFALSVIMRTLDSEGDPLASEVAAAFTTQEEVGSRGAITATYAIKPEYAIALDITLANDIPLQDDSEHISKIGAGPAIKAMDQIPTSMIGHIVPEELVTHLQDIARINQIPHQVEVQRAGSTDGAAIQTVASGVRTCGICIPSRYVHAHEVIAIDDLVNTTLLIYETLKSLKVNGFM